MAKGSDFEREICKKLSLWWTDDNDDSVFWRTACSGGRATVRGRQGKKTQGGYGDIMAMCPEGELLLKVVAIEIKRGYNKHTLHDLLDRSDNAAEQVYESWINQAQLSAEIGDIPYWMIIARRDRREPLVIMERRFHDKLDYDFKTESFISTYIRSSETYLDLSIVSLDEWLADVSPEDIKKIAEELE